MIVEEDRVERLVLLDWQDEPPPALDALMPPSLPASAVLVVRRVAVVAAPSAVPGVVVSEVADAARRAVRPTGGVVDPAAGAVLFADEADLLACYLVAVRTNRLGDWVWAQLAGMLPPPTVDAVVRDPGAPLAGLVRALEECGNAEPVLGALPPAGRLVLLHSLARQHHLWMRAERPTAPAPEPGTAAGVSAAVGTGEREVVRGPVVPATYDVGRRGSSRATARVTTGDGYVASLVGLVAALLGRDARPPAPTDWEPAAGSHLAPGTDTAVPHPRAGPPRPAGPRPVDRPGAGRGGRREDGRSGGMRPPPRPPGRADGPDGPGPVLEEVREAGTSTALAGVFYLVNAYRRLDLRTLALGDAEPWDVVDGLARSLVAAADHADDCLWAVLEALAGRSPGQPPSPDVLRRCTTALTVVLDDLALEPDEPALPDLVAVPGRLVVDRTHVEVLLSLGAVELAVRRRALDADPGWVPSLGRVIRFHFTEGGPG